MFIDLPWNNDDADFHTEENPEVSRIELYFDRYVYIYLIEVNGRSDSTTADETMSRQRYTK